MLSVRIDAKRCFRAKNATETWAFFRNIKVAEIIHPLDVNKMSES
jgi:hypothetical protein